MSSQRWLWTCGSLVSVAVLALSSSCQAPRNGASDEGQGNGKEDGPKPRKNTEIPVDPGNLPPIYARGKYIASKLMTIKLKVPGKETSLGDFTVYITNDYGKTWREIEPIAYDGKQMTVEVEQPGAYGFWAFYDRPGDDSGPSSPEPGTAPHYVVVVDVDPPKIELLASGHGGVFGPTANSILWRIEEENLDEKSIGIEYRPESSEAWLPVASGLENRGLHHWDLPAAGGRVHLRVTARDKAGNEGSSESQTAYTIDRRPPAVRLAAASPLQSRESRVSLPYEASDPEGTPLAEVLPYYRLRGEPAWTAAPGQEPGKAADLALPDGTYEVFLAGADAVGNVSPGPRPESAGAAFVVVDTLAPTLAVESDADPDRLYGPADGISFKWKAEDANLPGAPVSLELSPDGGNTWEAALPRLPAEGEATWKVPPGTEGKDFVFRLSVTDELGSRTDRILPESGLRIAISTLEVRSTVVEARANQEGRIEVRYVTEPVESPRALERVEIWTRPEGEQAWRLTEPPGTTREGPAVIDLPPGNHQLLARAVLSGYSEPEPGGDTPPELIFQFEPGVPQPKLLTFDGGVYRGGVTEKVKWTLSGAEATEIRLSFSQGEGKEYRPIHEGALPGSAREFDWTLPAASLSGCRVRVEAAEKFGRRFSFESPSPFAIDAEAPRVLSVTGTEYVGPVTEYAVRLATEVENRGEAKLSEIVLWWRAPGGPEWTELQKGPVAANFTRIVSLGFRLEAEGEHEFYATAADAVGNRSEAPAAGSPAMVRVVVDATPPAVELRSEERVIRAKDAIRLAWTASDANLGRDPVRIEYSRAEKIDWKVIKASLSAEGEFTWRVPIEVDNANVVFRVVAQDRAKNVGTSEKSARVGADAPAVTALSPDRSESAEILVSYRVDKLDSRAKLDLILAYRTADGGKTWEGPEELHPEPAPPAGGEGLVRVRVPRDGRWGISLAARDSVGGVEASPDPGSASEIVVLVDGTPPALEVRYDPAPSGVYGAGDAVLFSWSAQDANLVENPVSIDMTADEGRTWKAVAPSEPAQGEFRWKVPDGTAGKGFAFRLIAKDAWDRESEKVQVPSQGWITIDAFGTRLELVSAKATPKEQVEVAYRLTNFTGVRALGGVELYFRPADGKDWKRHTDVARDPEGAFLLDLAPGVYHFYGRALLAGADDPAPGPDTKPMLTFEFRPGPAALELLSFHDGGVHRGGEEKEIRWRADGSEGGVKFRLYFSQGGEYGLIENKATGESAIEGRTTALWKLPRITAEGCRLKVERIDRWGGTISAQSPVPFAVDSAPPRVLSAAGPEYLGAKADYRIAFKAEIADEGAAGAKGLDLWHRANAGSSWERVQQGIELGADFTRFWSASFRLEQEGVHEFYLAVRDSVGNALPDPDASTGPHFKTTIDVTPPKVELHWQAGPIFQAGKPVEFTWRGEDRTFGPDPVRIEWSLGAEGPWNEVAAALPAEGRTDWAIPRELDGRRVAFRAVAADLAGNVGVSGGTAPIDVGVKELAIAAEGKSLSASRDVRIPYRVVGLDPRARVEKIELWYSTDGGIAWKGPFEARTEGEREVLFQAPDDGDYGIVLVGTDSLGSAESPPARGQDPEATVLVDTKKPRVLILGFNAGDVYHNQPVYDVRWEPAADENLATRSIQIEYETEDGTKKAVVEATENAGRYPWTLPSGFGGRVRLSVTATDKVGNSTTSVAPAWLVVETTRPEVAILAPEGLVNRLSVEVVFRLARTGRLPLEKVTLWRSFDGGSLWEQAPGTYHMKRTIRDLGEGKYGIDYEGRDGPNGLWLVAYDQAGNANVGPQAGQAPQRAFVIDTAPPEVVIEDDPSGEIGAPGARASVRWRSQDANPMTAPATIRLSDSSGREWNRVLAEGMSENGTHEFELPEENGLNFRIRVEVKDAAGNLGYAEGGEFMVDGVAPNSQVEGPSDWGNSNRIPFEVSVKDNASGTGASRIEVWATELGPERNWRMVGELPQPGSLVLPVDLPDGRYGLVSAAWDRAGNRETKAGFADGVPGRETSPDLVCEVHAKGPNVRLVGALARGGVFQGGEIPIEWETNWDRASFQIEVRDVALSFSADGGASWQPIAEGLPNQPPYKWQAPRDKDYETCRVRVRVVDRYDMWAETQTPEDFKLDNNAPRSKIGFGGTKAWVSPLYFQLTGEDPSGEAAAALASAYEKYRAGELEAADLEARRAAELAPDRAEVVYLRALIARSRGEASGEIALLFSQAIALDPFHAKAHNDLGVLLLGAGRPEDAAASFRRAIRGAQNREAPPEELARYHHNLGLARYRMGDREAAIASFEAALGASTVPESHYYLALCLREEGKLEEARPHLEAVIRLFPADSEYRKWAAATLAE
ncbi:MAG: tetratricopeptide repeat protein [Planctomycetes bacterium]|nr:tetratricopeptide repeat protein [Planctomycetota bacterium]